MSCKLATLSFILLLPFFMTGHAMTWQTRSPGYWNNSDVWTALTVPPYTSGDTFIIGHPVIFDQSLVFNSGAYILIDEAGGLCGHRDITVRAGANMVKYGILELDTMRVPGGVVLCKAPGNVIFTRQGILTNNGYLEVNGCSLAVGPWFTCKLPEYNFQVPAAVSTVSSDMHFSVTPNPNNGRFVLEGTLPAGVATFDMTDMTGRLVYREILKQSVADSRQVTPSLSDGLYYWQLKSEHIILGKGKLAIKE